MPKHSNFTSGYVWGCCRYEGIDWRDRKNWKCSEDGTNSYDTSLQEALFIEKRDGKLLASPALALAAAKFERWLEEQV